MYLRNLLLLSLFFCGTTFAKDPMKDLGEYYEYDTEGSQNDQIRREVLHGCKTVASLPFKAVKLSGRKTKKLIKSMVSEIKSLIMLHDQKHNKKKINSALSNWENIMVHDHTLRHGNLSKKQALTYFPTKAFDTLQSILFNVGISLPISVFRSIKGAIYGGFNGAFN